MSGNLASVLAIVVLGVALAWSLLLTLRLRDWRLGLLPLLLLGVFAREIWALQGARQPLVNGLPNGFLGLGLGVLVFAMVMGLDRVLRKREVVGRKEAERALRPTLERMESLVETSPDIIFNTSQRGLESLGPAFERITGFLRQEWLDRPLDDLARLVHPEDVEHSSEMFAAVMRGEVFKRHEIRVKRRDGEWAVLELAIGPERRDGRIVGAVGIARDITVPKQIEAERQQALDRIERIVGHLDACFWSGEVHEDGSFRVAYVSPGFRRIWGYDPEDLYEDSELWLKTVFAEDREVAQDVLARAIERKRADVATYRIVTRSGELRRVEDSISPIVDGQGRLLGLDGMALDVTESDEIRQELRVSEARYRSLFEQSHDAILLVDPVGAGRLMQVNPAAVALFGYDSPEEMEGLSMEGDLYWSAEERLGFREELETRGFVRDRHVRGKRKDGSVLSVEVSATPVRDEAGEVILIQGTLRELVEKESPRSS